MDGSVGVREAALIQRCAAGDETAFAELVAEHQRMVVQLAMNLLGDRDEALDLSQDVFIRVFPDDRPVSAVSRRSAPGSTASPSIRPAIVTASGADASGPTRCRSTLHVEAHGDFQSAAETGPDRMLAQKELAALSSRTRCDALPFDQRTSSFLREVDGLSYDEIAYSLGVGGRHREVAAHACAPDAARRAAGSKNA